MLASRGEKLSFKFFNNLSLYLNIICFKAASEGGEDDMRFIYCAAAIANLLKLKWVSLFRKPYLGISFYNIKWNHILFLIILNLKKKNCYSLLFILFSSAIDKEKAIEYIQSSITYEGNLFSLFSLVVMNCSDTWYNFI